MGLSKDRLRADLDAVAGREPLLAGALASAGYPQPRIHERGHASLLRIIVGQQVSVASAAAVWGRMAALLGPQMPAHALLESSFEELRACGLSRQKQDYARSLAELVASGDLTLSHLPTDDEEAIAQLMRIKGIGRWSAEIYLLFAEGRGDIWPAGDLAVQAGIGRILRMAERPSERETRLIAEPWRPHRGAVAIFTWHVYQNPAL